MLFQEGGEELTGVEGTELGRKGLKAAVEKGTINLIVPNLTFLNCVNLLSIGEDALNQYLLHRECVTLTGRIESGKDNFAHFLHSFSWNF